MDTLEQSAKAQIERRRKTLNVTIFRLSAANAGLLVLWWLLSTFHPNQGNAHELSYILELGVASLITVAVWAGLLVAAVKRSLLWWCHERPMRDG